MSKTSAAPTSLIVGPQVAIVATTDHARPNTCPATWSAMKTWTTTATGATMQATATSGFPAAWKLAGRPITTAIGTGLLPGDTPGWMTPPGVTRPFTMDAG